MYVLFLKLSYLNLTCSCLVLSRTLTVDPISVTGDAQAILGVILNIIRHHVIDCLEDPVHGREGIELLEYWAQEVVGMSGNLFCSDFVTTHIESDGNLEKLANHLKVELPQYLGKNILHNLHSKVFKFPITMESI